MSGMAIYFLRRLLFVPVTFLAITFLVYAVLRIVPGGPIEQAEARLRLKATRGEGGGGGSSLSNETGLQLDEEGLHDLERYYALDRPIPVGYLQWLGLWPRDRTRRVPPVDPALHAAAIGRLGEAHAAVRAAEDAFQAALAPSALVGVEGRIARAVDEARVPAAVQQEARRLWATTFGVRRPLAALFERTGFTTDGERFLQRVDDSEVPSEAAARRAEFARARAALAAAEREEGYVLDEVGKPLARAFRPLRELALVRAQATERIQALLEEDGWIERGGDVYRRLEDAETRTPALAPVREQADRLVAGGFGKRDELYALLDAHDLAWEGGVYFRRLEPEGRAGKEDRVEAVRRVADARRLAEEELARIREEQGFEVSSDGAVAVVDRRLSGILQGDFGQSYAYNEPVLSLIGSKMEVSIQFGLIGYFLAWIVCVPLGVLKAIRHRTAFDTVTSVLVFLGYAIPGFVLCLILLSQVAVHVDWLPLGGYKPANIEELGWWDSFVGRVRHMLIPVAGYMVGGFASMTILMKNSLLENLGKDYVRTAFAKGLPERRVIFVHALRNSLIPITSGVGHALGLLFAGSFLIEKTCNIDGMGLLGFHAVLQRDYPIILGLLVLLELIRLLGNILSDVVWALVDPRIRFG